MKEIIAKPGDKVRCKLMGDSAYGVVTRVEPEAQYPYVVELQRTCHIRFDSNEIEVVGDS